MRECYGVFVVGGFVVWWCLYSNYICIMFVCVSGIKCFSFCVLKN